MLPERSPPRTDKTFKIRCCMAIEWPGELAQYYRAPAMMTKRWYLRAGVILVRVGSGSWRSDPAHAKTGGMEN